MAVGLTRAQWHAALVSLASAVILASVAWAVSIEHRTTAVEVHNAVAVKPEALQDVRDRLTHMEDNVKTIDSNVKEMSDDFKQFTKPWRALPAQGTK